MASKLSFFIFLGTYLLFSPLKSFGDEIKITPSVTVEERYTDNLFFDDRDKTDDLITKITPRLELSRRNERYTGRLSGSLERLTYADTGGLNATNGRVQGELQYRFTPRLDGSMHLEYAKTSQNDRDLEETGILLDQSDRDRYTFSVTGAYRLSEKNIGHTHLQLPAG